MPATVRVCVSVCKQPYVLFSYMTRSLSGSKRWNLECAARWRVGSEMTERLRLSQMENGCVAVRACVVVSLSGGNHTYVS